MKTACMTPDAYTITMQALRGFLLDTAANEDRATSELERRMFQEQQYIASRLYEELEAAEFVVLHTPEE